MIGCHLTFTRAVSFAKLFANKVIRRKRDQNKAKSRRQNRNREYPLVSWLAVTLVGGCCSCRCSCWCYSKKKLEIQTQLNVVIRGIQGIPGHFSVQWGIWPKMRPTLSGIDLRVKMLVSVSFSVYITFNDYWRHCSYIHCFVGVFESLWSYVQTDATLLEQHCWPATPNIASVCT